MSGTTPVCQPGSARKCVCRACKPYGKPKQSNNFVKKFQCHCTIPNSVETSSLESLSSSSDLYQEILKTKLINRCNCIGCKPVFTYKRKRLCRCENTTQKIKVNLSSFQKHKVKKRRYSRGTVIDTANKQLSSEIVNDISNKKRINHIINDDDDEFIIVAKKSSSFVLDKQIDTVSNSLQNDKPILKKTNYKYNKDNNDENIIPLKKSNSGLTFSREKLVVEYNLKKRNDIFFEKGFYYLGFNKFAVLNKRRNKDKREETDRNKRNNKNMSQVKKKEFYLTVPIEKTDELENETRSTGYKDEDSAKVLRERRDSNVMYYSKYISEHDTNRIAYGLHRLLHNYAMFRCEDRAITEGILSEGFIQKLSEGFDLFLKNAYFYDPYYQPISFKRRYGYIEVHVKVGVNDIFAEKHRMFKKVFLVIFQRGSVKYILTKYKQPGKMIEKHYNYAVNDKKCRDVWCRVDLITAIVHRKHRRIRHRVIETLYDIITTDEKGFFKLVDPLEDLWICLDFDTESQRWSKTERSQFIKQMRRESNPYHKENIKRVASIETKLEKERKTRKRKYKPTSET